MAGIVALLLLAPSVALAAPHVLLLPAVGTTRQVTVHGRVLAEAPSGGDSALSRNLKRLAAKNLEGVRVEVSFAGRTVETVSADDGEFEATFQALRGPRFPPGPGTVEASAGGAPATAAVQLVPDLAPFVVVSDFDDTVAVTNVKDKVGLVRASLLEEGDTQPPVPGMAGFYRCLLARTPGPGLAFVSGSPVQYAPRVLDFLGRHGFPAAGLYLRNLGLSTLSGYKQPVLRALLKALPQPLVLVGDSGEHDPEVYAQLRREFPDRILAVYVRDAGGDTSATRLPGMTLFREAREAALDAVTRGLAEAGCVAKELPAP